MFKLSHLLLISLCILLLATDIQGSVFKKKYAAYKERKLEKKKVTLVKNQIKEIWSSEYYLQATIATMGAIATNLVFVAEKYGQGNCTHLLNLVESYEYFKGIVDESFDELQSQLRVLGGKVHSEAGDSTNKDAHHRQLQFMNRLIDDYEKHAVGKKMITKVNALISLCYGATQSSISD